MCMLFSGMLLRSNPYSRSASRGDMSVGSEFAPLTNSLAWMRSTSIEAMVCFVLLPVSVVRSWPEMLVSRAIKIFPCDNIRCVGMNPKLRNMTSIQNKRKGMDL